MIHLTADQNICLVSRCEAKM